MQNQNTAGERKGNKARGEPKKSREKEKM